MSYCIHCGKPSDDGLRYCPYCGKPKDVVDSGESAYLGDGTVADAQNVGGVHSQASQSRKRRSSAAVIIVCAIVGVIAAGAIVLVFLGPSIGVQFPWMQQEEDGVVVQPDESSSDEVSTRTDAGHVEGVIPVEPDEMTSSASGSGEATEDVTAQTPTEPLSVTGVATGDSGWPYEDSTMLKSYKIRSSSTLDPQGSNTYEAANVADNNVSTCWAEGVQGLGEGEWISFENVTGSTQSISGFEIVNGYGKEGRFETNTTPVGADLYLIDGSGNAEKVAQLDLMASGAPQLLEFSPAIELGPNESLRLTITESKPMSEGADQDACISEVKILS